MKMLAITGRLATGPPSTRVAEQAATTSWPGPYDLRVKSSSLFKRGFAKLLTMNLRSCSGKRLFVSPP